MSQIKKGAILSYVSIVLTNTIGLFLTPFIVRSLGDSEFGLYSLIGAFVGYLTVMDLGLNKTIIRYVAKYRAEEDLEGERKFLGSVMIVYFVISLAVMIIGLLLYFNLHNFFGETLTETEMGKAKIMMGILILNLMIGLPGGAFTAICNAYEYFVFPRSLSIIKYLFRSALVVVILKFGADAVGLVLLDTAINIVVILITFVFVKSKLQVRFNFKEREKQLFKEIFSYSVWIFLFALISQLQWQGGQLVIGATLDTTQVAIYAIGIMLGSYYGAFSAAISSLFLPRATQMVVKQSSSEDLTNMMIKIARFSLFSLIIIFVGFGFLGKDFIRLWIGENYNDAYYIAILVMIGYTIPLIQTFANSLLEAKKLFKFKAGVYFISLGTGVLMSYFFAKDYGIKSVINFIVGFWILGQIIMNIFFRYKLGLKMASFFKGISRGLIWVSFLMILFSSLLVKVTMFGGWMDLIFKSGILIMLYVPLLFFIGMNEEERNHVLHLIRKRNYV